MESLKSKLQSINFSFTTYLSGSVELCLLNPSDDILYRKWDLKLRDLWPITDIFVHYGEIQSFFFSFLFTVYLSWHLDKRFGSWVIFFYFFVFHRI